MASVLLAIDDVGLAIQLQEALEGTGHQVRLDPAQAAGPGKVAERPDVVLLAGGRLADQARAWGSVVPPPALLAVVSTTGERDAAAGARMAAVPASVERGELLIAIDGALVVRYAGGLRSSAPRAVALRALNLSSSGDDGDDDRRLLAAARQADVAMVKEALRWHAAEYVTASPTGIERLRDLRALSIPEVELIPALDGTRTLQNALRTPGRLDPWGAARLVWALASLGQVSFSAEPLDQLTPARRRLTQVRLQLRARQQRLARATFYDVLEMAPRAEPAEAARAVELLALRFEPQRLADLDLSTLQPVIAPMWQQVLEARGVLSSWNDRARYNSSIAAQRDLTTEWAIERLDPAGGFEALGRSQQALLDGDVYKALSTAALAGRLCPGHPELEVSLAWTRYRADVHGGKDRAEPARRERAVGDRWNLGHRPWPRALV
ncbi:MAG TPA: hypothetical protein VL172_11195, partial [Kofleriaceae bacterium]|nr:hypothetical protein [Kofleriaceae bacterium]